MMGESHVLGIIGGSGLTQFAGVRLLREERIETPYGAPSAPLVVGIARERPMVFLPRHGSEHSIPPHRINFRANLWALYQVGVREVIGVAAVGGIRDDLGPGTLAVPDQIIDYTYGRSHTYCDGESAVVTHIDFTHPYSARLRQRLIETAAAIGQPIVTQATHGVTQGPRLETAHEVRRLERDGCDLVGMTGMPEAALARELGLDYACCALVVNWAAGKAGQSEVSLEQIQRELDRGMEKVRSLLVTLM